MTFEKVSKKEQKKWNCVDCGTNTIVDNCDFYMVKNELWKKFGVGRLMLCLKCFIKRLERPLKREDITNCPANHENPFLRELYDV